jgi:hypothetical protein
MGGESLPEVGFCGMVADRVCVGGGVDDDNVGLRNSQPGARVRLRTR